MMTNEGDQPATKADVFKIVQEGKADIVRLLIPMDARIQTLGGKCISPPGSV